MNVQPISAPMDIDPFKNLLLRVCGFSFEDVREKTLVSGLHRRMRERGAQSSAEYLGLLTREPEELQRLVSLLTVNETYFFREIEQLRLLTEVLIPEILAERSPRPLRILSAGCSSGEEPYTVAMLLRDIHGPECDGLFSIVGVDLDPEMISVAKQGVYGANSFRNQDPAALARHFDPAPGGYRIKDEVRKLVDFKVGNLLKNPYSERIPNADAALYRNVSIYFPEKVQRDIFTRLAEGLNQGGYLVVGAIESMHHNIGVLSLVERDNLFVFRKTRGADRTQDRRARQITHDKSPERTTRRAPLFAARTAKPAPPEKTGPDSKAEAARLMDEALALLRAGRAAAAIDRLDELTRQKRGDPKAYAVKAGALLGEMRLEECREACMAALECEPFCLEASLLLGLVALQQGETDDALTHFREAIYLDGNCWPAHFYTAEILYHGEGRKRALGAYRTAANILESGGAKEREQRFFPLNLNAEHCLAVCRHKLHLSQANG